LDTRIKAGRTENILIHSPALTFGEAFDQAVGKTYRLRAIWEPGQPGELLAMVSDAPPPASPGVGSATSRPALATQADRYGDPLPLGAAIRLGTARLRQGANTIRFAAEDSEVIADGTRWSTRTGRRLSSATQPDDNSSTADRVNVEFNGQALLFRKAGERRILLEVAADKDPRPTGDFEWAYSPQADCLAIRNRDRIDLWNLTRRKVDCTINIPQMAGKGLLFSPDGNLIAGTTEAWMNVDPVPGEFSVCVWRVSDGKLLFQAPMHRRAYALCFTPDSKAIACGTFDGLLQAWQTADGKEVFSFQAHVGYVKAIAFSSHGTAIASVGEDGRIRLTNYPRPSDLLPLPGHSQPVTRIAFSADGEQLASGGEDGRTFLWDLATQLPVLAPPAAGGPDHRISWVGFMRDGRLAICPDDFGYFVVVDPKTGTSERVTPYTEPVVALSPNETQLASAGYRQKISIVGTVGDKTPVREFACGRMPWALAWSPDGKMLACSTGYNKKGDDRIELRLIFLDGKLEPFSLPVEDIVRSLAFSRDGTFLISGGFEVNDSHESVVTIWDIAERKKAGSLRIKGRGSVSGLVFSSGGRRMAAAISETAVVWDFVLRKEVAQFKLSDDKSFSGIPAFSPDGRLLGTGLRDGTILLWNVPADQPTHSPTDKVGPPQATSMPGSKL
jgi:WD40 repeat protein